MKYVGTGDKGTGSPSNVYRGGKLAIPILIISDHKRLQLSGYNMLRPAFVNTLFPVTRPHHNLLNCIGNY